ncbi:MAG: serine/threonine-protein kinase [Streptosporangiaceae bacterium]
MEPLRPGDPATAGPYELKAKLGRGPQGVVYLGSSPGQEPVAVKLLHARFGGSHRTRAVFAHELAAAQQVEDPCVARVLGAGLERGAPYIASELVDGVSLREVVEEAGPRLGAPLDRLAIGVAGALWSMHRAGVIHRDLNPGNVLLDPSGPRVIDFGYGSALDSGGIRGVLGGPSFRAPEQISGGEVTSAVDVWAWGCLLVYASSGRSPFGEGSISEVAERISAGAPDFGGLDGHLRLLVEDCLAKSPRARPSAQQLLLELLGTTAPSARSWSSLKVVRPDLPPPALQPIQPYLGLNGVHSVPLRPLLVAASVVIPLIIGAGVARFGGDLAPDSVVAQVAAASADTPIKLRGQYRIRGVRGGVVDGSAFADYELTNAAGRSQELRMPGQLLIRRSALETDAQARCAPTALPAMCTLAAHTVVTKTLSGSGALMLKGGSLVMPPRSSYTLRITTDGTAGSALTQSDLAIYVTDPQFSARTLAVPFA